jgi:hypothetical protein
MDEPVELFLKQIAVAMKEDRIRPPLEFEKFSTDVFYDDGSPIFDTRWISLMCEGAPPEPIPGKYVSLLVREGFVTNIGGQKYSVNLGKIAQYGSKY